jgi:aspartate racemase
MIGIIGGVGPYAGLDLLRKIYDNTLAAKDQEHLDTMLLSVPSAILDRTEYLEGDVQENPGLAMAEVAKRLHYAGSSVIGIPCNTAHVDEIFGVMLEDLAQAGCSLRVMHMIQETVSFIGSEYPEFKRIGVLSTTGTYRSGVYRNALKSAGYQVERPTLQMQEEVIHPAIYHPEFGIKSISSPVQPQAKANLMKGFKYLKSLDVEAVILGCTEIPLAFPNRNIEGMVAIDPTTVLARALIREDAAEKLKPYIKKDG